MRHNVHALMGTMKIFKIVSYAHFNVLLAPHRQSAQVVEVIDRG